MMDNQKSSIIGIGDFASQLAERLPTEKFKNKSFYANSCRPSFLEKSTIPHTPIIKRNLRIFERNPIKARKTLDEILPPNSGLIFIITNLTEKMSKEIAKLLANYTKSKNIFLLTVIPSLSDSPENHSMREPIDSEIVDAIFIFGETEQSFKNLLIQTPSKFTDFTTDLINTFINNIIEVEEPTLFETNEIKSLISWSLRTEAVRVLPKGYDRIPGTFNITSNYTKDISKAMLFLHTGNKEPTMQELFNLTDTLQTLLADTVSIKWDCNLDQNYYKKLRINTIIQKSQNQMNLKNKEKNTTQKTLFEHLPHPQVILNLPDMDIVLKNMESDSPDEEKIVKSYLINHNLLSKVSTQNFLETILKNPVFDSPELILGAEKILKVSVNTEDTLENIVSLSFRYIHSKSFQEFIDDAFQKNNEINPFLESFIIEGLNHHSSISKDLDYIGAPILTDPYRLVSNLEDLLRIENRINNYSGEFWNHGIDTETTWDRMINKELYVFFSEKPQPIIFKISKNAYMQWFEIEEAISTNHGEIDEEITTQMAHQVIQPENQFFFQQNYLHNNPVDDFRFPHPRKNNHLFQAGQEFLEEIKKTDQTLEVRELKIKDNKSKRGLFQYKNGHVSESLYNKIKMNIKDMFVELEADQSYLLSKIDSHELLNELIRRKSDDLFNYCMASLDKEFLKASSLKKPGDQATPGNPYEAMFKNMLLKLNMSELTKATHEAGVSALLVNINKEIQNKTTGEILEAIPEMDLIQSFLENKGCYVKTKEEQNGYSLFKFLCDRLSVSYFTDKSSLLEMLQDQLNESAF